MAASNVPIPFFMKWYSKNFWSPIYENYFFLTPFVSQIFLLDPPVSTSPSPWAKKMLTPLIKIRIRIMEISWSYKHLLLRSLSSHQLLERWGPGLFWTKSSSQFCHISTRQKLFKIITWLKLLADVTIWKISVHDRITFMSDFLIS